MTRLAVGLTALTLTSHITVAQTADVCNNMVLTATHNVGLANDSSEFLDTIFDDYCDRSGEVKQDATDVGISAVIKLVPVSLTYDDSHQTSNFRNFCRNYSRTVQSRSSSFRYQSIVIENALKDAVDCYRINRNGTRVTTKIQPPDRLLFTVSAGPGIPVTINGVSHDPKVTCTGGSGLFQRVSFNQGTTHTVQPNDANYLIECTRPFVGMPGGGKLYEETSVTLVSTAGEQQDVHWPQDPVLPIRDANQLQAMIGSLQKDLQQTKKQLDQMGGDPNGKVETQFGNNDPRPAMCPAGQVLVGVQVGWAGTCNGQCNADGHIFRDLKIYCRNIAKWTSSNPN